MASLDLLENDTLDNINYLDKPDLGKGAYGRVFAVNHCNLICAAKEIHPALVESTVIPEQRNAFTEGFIRECLNNIKLRHPNIVQFMGVHYTKESVIPIMIMELMDMSLTSYIQKSKKIDMAIKFSILHDVSLGLNYLHLQKPAVVHRDMSPNNILLKNDSLVAKIGDLGVAKAIDAGNKNITKLTKAPGAIDFMPPETLEDNPLYGTPVDVFSFAGIFLFVFCEQWPSPASPKLRDSKTNQLIALSEVERRRQYLVKMKGKVAEFKQLVVSCLDDNPDGRPTMEEVTKLIAPFTGREVPPSLQQSTEKNAFEKSGNSYTFKVVFTGLSGVGKTSLLNCYFDGVLSTINASSTIGSDISYKTLKIEQDTIKLALWDTGGQEAFGPLMPLYYRNADAVIVVFDVTNCFSFNKCKSLLDDAKKYAGSSVYKVLVGNKKDRIDRKITTKQGESFASHEGLLYFETSPLKSFPEELFTHVVHELYKNMQENTVSSPAIFLNQPAPPSSTCILRKC